MKQSKNKQSLTRPPRSLVHQRRHFAYLICICDAELRHTQLDEWRRKKALMKRRTAREPQKRIYIYTLLERWLTNAAFYQPAAAWFFTRARVVIRADV